MVILEINYMERIVIIDCRADEETIKSLKNKGYTVIPTMILSCVYDAIASHADIQIHYLGNSRFVCAPEAFEHYKKALPGGFTLIKGNRPLGAKYPNDIAYNAAAVGDAIICSARHTEPYILSNYARILNVNQGYAKCSTCVVSENAVITADSSIFSAAAEQGIDALKIRAGHIALRGMDYGFIGGASGLIEKHVIAFNGELGTHPDGDKIKQFCNNHDVEIAELKNGILCDIGTFISNIEL